jgi:dTDP-4-amino-4,6-dideoxygalactose transaminase
VVRTTRRDALKQRLTDAQVETGVHYPIALPKLKAYASLGQQNEPMFANQADEQVLSLPLGEHLSDADLSTITGVIRRFFA